MASQPQAVDLSFETKGHSHVNQQRTLCNSERDSSAVPVPATASGPSTKCQLYTVSHHSKNSQNLVDFLLLFLARRGCLLLCSSWRHPDVVAAAWRTCQGSPLTHVPC